MHTADMSAVQVLHEVGASPSGVPWRCAGLPGGLRPRASGHELHHQPAGAAKCAALPLARLRGLHSFLLLPARVTSVKHGMVNAT